jgi:thiol-disulfide isomerase/thioredoxin
VLAALLVTRVVIGAAFPAHTLPATDGHPIVVPAPNHVVVVDVFATWCAPCREALPIIDRVRSRFDERVTFISVSVDDGPDAAERVLHFASTLGVSGPFLLDSDHALSGELVLRKLPTTYIIDADGIVRHINNGFGPGYERRLQGWIEDTLRRDPRPKHSTP